MNWSKRSYLLVLVSVILISSVYVGIHVWKGGENGTQDFYSSGDETTGSVDSSNAGDDQTASQSGNNNEDLDEELIANIEQELLNQSALSEFEDSIFSYINSELDKLLSEENDDLSASEIEDALIAIGNNATDRMNAFRNSLALSADQAARVNEIELYVNMQVTKNRLRSEDIIRAMENGYGKLAVLMTYLESFALTEKHDQLEDFVLNENSWTRELEGNLAEQVQLILFKTSPVGKPMPNHFKGARDIQGVKLSLNEFAGKVVLVDFWATWCEPCLESIPYHKEAYYDFHDSGFEIIYVNLDEDRQVLLDFLEEVNLPWLHFYEENAIQGETAQKYGVERLPTSYLIDRNGQVIENDLKGSELRTKLESLFSL